MAEDTLSIGIVVRLLCVKTLFCCLPIILKRSFLFSYTYIDYSFIIIGAMIDLLASLSLGIKSQLCTIV